jgi:hypothetical protein
MDGVRANIVAIDALAEDPAKDSVVAGITDSA